MANTAQQEFLIKLRAIADMSDVDAAAKQLRALADEFAGTGKAAGKAKTETEKADKAADGLAKSTKATARASNEDAAAAKELAAALSKVVSQISKLGKEADDVSPKIEKAARAKKQAADAADDLGKKTKSAGQGNKNMGTAVLELSRGLEDLQYGVRGVLNNIPQLLMSLGIGSGLTGIVSMAAVAVSVLWNAFGGADGDEAKAKDGAEKLAKIAEGVRDRIKAAASESRSQFAEQIAQMTAEGQKEYEKQTAAVEKVNDALARQISKVREARRAFLEQSDAQAALDMANVDLGGGSESDKIRQRSAIEQASARRKTEAAMQDEMDKVIQSQAAVNIQNAQLEVSRKKLIDADNALAGAQERQKLYTDALSESQRLGAEAAAKNKAASNVRTEAASKADSMRSPFGYSGPGVVPPSDPNIVALIADAEQKAKDLISQAKAIDEAKAKVDARLAELDNNRIGHSVNQAASTKNSLADVFEKQLEAVDKAVTNNQDAVDSYNAKIEELNGLFSRQSLLKEITVSKDAFNAQLKDPMDKIREAIQGKDDATKEAFSQAAAMLKDDGIIANERAKFMEDVQVLARSLSSDKMELIQQIVKLGTQQAQIVSQLRTQVNQQAAQLQQLSARP